VGAHRGGTPRLKFFALFVAEHPEIRLVHFGALVYGGSQRVVNTCRGILLHPRHHVRIKVERYAHLAMAKAFADHLWMDAICQHVGGVGMPQIVEAGTGQGRLAEHGRYPHCGFAAAVECEPDAPRLYGAANTSFLYGDDNAPIADPIVRRRIADLLTNCPTLAAVIYRRREEEEAASLARLTHSQLVAHVFSELAA
jgi:hypothetical protein